MDAEPRHGLVLGATYSAQVFFGILGVFWGVLQVGIGRFAFLICNHSARVGFGVFAKVLL